MRSKIESLRNRGFVLEGVENDYNNCSFEQKVTLLKSKLPVDRTLGARLLRKYSEFNAVEVLIDALKKEKKLYSKIEICNTLVTYGKRSIIPLINELGKIGNNQYRAVPQKLFEKKSFPLPRDIAARTLIRIGVLAIPELINVLKSNDSVKISEAVDANGFICFYNRNANACNELINCYNRNYDNDLIKWKIIRAMSAFPQSKEFLIEQHELIKNKRIKLELERSLKLLEKQ